MRENADTSPHLRERVPVGSLYRWIRRAAHRVRTRRTMRKLPFLPAPTALERVIAWLSRSRLLHPLMEGILPTPRLLTDETVQLEIRMAPYRIQAVRWFATALLVLLLLSLVAAILAFLLKASSLLTAGMWLLFFLALIGFAHTVRNLLLYHQWRFILTNKRIIIIAPDSRRRGFADAVYLKGGRIQVVDTSWSSSPIWGFFQAVTGARDVILSLAGYEFKPEGAEVKGGLRFPDVMPDDIARLEELIFG